MTCINLGFIFDNRRKTKILKYPLSHITGIIMESHRHQGKPDITQIILNGNLTEAEVQRKPKVFPKNDDKGLIWPFCS